jgi:hypothetical protein
MPSFAEKLELLLESYDQSKRTPAYKELNAKYKALKKQHRDLLQIITSLTAIPSDRCVRFSECEAPPKKRNNRALRKQAAMRDNTESEISLEDELIASDKVRVVDELIASDKVCAPVCEETDDQEIVLDLENISKHEIVDVPVVSSNLSENTTKNAELIVETVIEQIAAEIIAETEAGGVIESDDHTEEFDEVEEEDVEVEEDEDVEVEVEDEEVEIEVEEDEVEVEEEEEVEIEVEEEEEEEEEAGVYEIEINGTRYFTTNEQDGVVYEAIGEDDVGDEIGKFVKGKLVLF